MRPSIRGGRSISLRWGPNLTIIGTILLVWTIGSASIWPEAVVAVEVITVPYTIVRIVDPRLNELKWQLSDASQVSLSVRSVSWLNQIRWHQHKPCFGNLIMCGTFRIEIAFIERP